MENFFDYANKYPQLPIEIILFFSEANIQDGKHIHKKIFQFCSYFAKKYSCQDIPHPRIVAAMCDILCENGKMSLIQKGGIDHTDNSYYCTKNGELLNNENLKFYLNKYLSNIIYGFKFIYNDYQKYILPIEYINKIGDKSIGTGFLYKNGFATAKHCIEGANKIAIKGISKSQLDSAKYEISDNKLLDLLFIRFSQPILDSITFRAPRFTLKISRCFDQRHIGILIPMHQGKKLPTFQWFLS